MDTRFRATKEDVMGYLEDKVKDDIATDREYRLYIDYCKFGNEVFTYGEYKIVIKRLVQEMKMEYN